jgi:hypothetical protein
MATLFTSPKQRDRSGVEDEILNRQVAQLKQQEVTLAKQEQTLAQQESERSATKRVSAGLNAGRSVLLYDETGTLGEPDASGLRKRLGA